jgi:hypothetical protein
MKNVFKYCTSWLSTQTFHKGILYFGNLTWLYGKHVDIMKFTPIKYGLAYADFHGTHQTWRPLYAHFLYLISAGSDSDCGRCRHGGFTILILYSIIIIYIIIIIIYIKISCTFVDVLINKTWRCSRSYADFNETRNEGIFLWTSPILSVFQIWRKYIKQNKHFLSFEIQSAFLSLLVFTNLKIAQRRCAKISYTEFH